MVFNGPIPPYNNLPIQANYYQPSQFFIASITLGQTTLVQTTVNHNYVIAQNCRIIIPQANGCLQISGQQGYVISIPQPNQVILSIDSSQNVNSFISTSLPQQPQILPIGDINCGAINSNGVNSNF